MWTASCMDEVCEGSTSLDRSFVLGWPTCNCVATFSSADVKEKWLSLMRSRIKEEKENDHPKTIPLKVHTKEMGNLLYKTIAVSNSDSANEVVRLALQQFGMVGSAKDFQLWVSSRKDDAPYPLIGHEFPFSIQMNHIREPPDETGGKNDDDTPPERQMELILEQLQSDNQCQFILRPSRVATGHSVVVDPDQKLFKRRRSLINWAFWRGSSNQLDDPSSPAADRLFGLPLRSVCVDDNLPKPIMDMLVFLFQEGPYTRGIFRRSAGAKACRELREKLDSGVQLLPISRQSIFVIAAVFKDFLRCIPGGLLSSELYEKWTAIVDPSSETSGDDLTSTANDDQLKAIRGLLASLPPENLLLLKHVLAVLYSIRLRAEENQMNAFNLAVCIAPSMLSPPSSSSPEVEGRGTKKVCKLVHIMIENCVAVVGEDVAALFDAFPPRCSTDGLGSDMSSCQMTDSSYDSLENELHDGSGSPFQPIQRSRRKPDSRSCDSVLTLSDCDLDQTDTDPENTHHRNIHHLSTQLSHPVKSSPSPPRPSSPHSLSPLPKGAGQTRRSSEPAIWTSSSLGRFLEWQGKRQGSYDCVTQRGGDDELFLKHLNTPRLEKHRSPGKKSPGEMKVFKRWREHLKPPPLNLGTSFSGSCSPPASPTRSSASSLDSAFSQHSADLARPIASFKAAVRSSPRSPGIVSTTSPGPATPSPRESNPKERFDWSLLKSSHGLHPNTWLKKEHRLSLSRDNVCVTGGHPEGRNRARSQESGLPAQRKKSTSPVRPDEPLLENQNCWSGCSFGSEKPLTVKEMRALQNQTCDRTSRGLPNSLFYTQAVRSLALHPEKTDSQIPKRRASEPGWTCLRPDRESADRLEHIHRQAVNRQDGGSSPHAHGYKAHDVKLQDEVNESQFCLSPSSTDAIRDYFFLHGDGDTQSNVKKTQDVTSALVHGKRQWMRRCSDTQLDDFEKLLFAEESYV